MGLAVMAPDAVAAPSIEAVHLVSRVGKSGEANDKPKRALHSDGVTLFIVLEVRDGKRRRWFSKAPRVVLGSKPLAVESMARAPAHVATWFRIEPALENMSNTESGRFRFENIDYRETAIAGSLGKAELRADVRPTLTKDRGDGFGTMRFGVQLLDTAGRKHSTPGARSRKGRGFGGLSDRVHRVSLRPDDSYVGYLSELYGQPYIWASAGRSDRTHQSEHLEGADCADFVTYGWRRSGHRVPYGWTGSLAKHARRIAGPASPGEDGVYMDSRGQRVRFPQRGDLLLFPRHVGVVVEDRGHIGLLDQGDIMFHTLFKSPEMEPIGDTAYASRTLKVLRWHR